MRDIQGAQYLLQAVDKQGKDLYAEKKRTCEALEIIHTVAGCAYNKPVSMIGLSYQLQTFNI